LKTEGNASRLTFPRFIHRIPFPRPVSSSSPVFAALRRRFRLLIPITLGLSQLAAHADQDALARAWGATAANLLPEAKREFDALDGAEAELGGALLLLLRQPKTQANVELAAARLAVLAEREPADEISRAARYYLGRLEHVHRSPASPGAARAHYRRLIADAPGSFFAECAAVKLAIIDLYELVDPEEHRARFNTHRAVAESLAHPSAKRDLSLLLADVSLQFGYGESVALEELLRADRAGVTRTLERANVWVRIGELARVSGNEEVARAYYRRFLETYRRDSRRTMVEERLESLNSDSRR